MAVWLSNTARMNYVCPKCKAKKGEFCRMPSGRYHNGVGGIHSIRMSLLSKKEIEISRINMKVDL
jgi:hypothetical protein